ncbi:Alg9-like mannosyltransferase family-domain-containing protein [Lophiotrema nucula]|uniref:Mannosyltransferase n=1 Tax=Lophiotrema nucula TaxID=690887 RepID=A0A6A5YKU2_9PLEO|nr:Alg9-like mannosyltransferase family-domain-containing protein [Lophiotrema nucula]
MWRRTYFLLILVRIYFALSPSYLHPDENFQGPEVIAGRVFSYPVHETWEFTSANPIRSTFPLWLAYGWPMYLLRWLSEGFGYGEVSPAVAYWTLRVLMLTLSVVLEDGAIQELVQSTPTRARRVAVLVASSYVTWTFQTHTFSNSLETLLVSWSLVLVRRIVEDKKRSGVLASSILGFLVVVGVFNRITFPAYLLLPSLSLLPHFQRKPFSLVFVAISALFTAFIAICVDTAFYTSGDFHFSNALRHPVITPLNNFNYNRDPTNLAQHGLHPFYQHVLVNLPQLLGPAFPLLFLLRRQHLNPQLLSAISGVALLSLFPHQEARFLLPAVPLILSSIRLPRSQIKLWVSSWVIFNIVLGVLMGVFHQGGIVPVQMHIAKTNETVSHAYWWKTYSPPIWLLNGKNEELKTVDLMGMPGSQMLERITEALPPCRSRKPPTVDNASVYLVAPRSAYFLKQVRVFNSVTLSEVWSYRRHLNLDDMDFAEDGIWKTLGRVVGDRGLVVWRVGRNCFATVD